MMKQRNNLLLFFMVLGLTAATMKGNGYNIGDKVDDFTLKNVDESMVSLSDYNDHKGAIVIFTCNHCPYAQAYEDRIIALQEKYGDQYPVIAINPNDPNVYEEDSFENMQVRAKEKNYPFVYLMDETQNVTKDFGASKTPHVYLLKNKGKQWEVAYIGAIDDNYKDADEVEKKYLENAIHAINSGKKPAPNTTKAIGCSIKWKE